MLHLLKCVDCGNLFTDSSKLPVAGSQSSSPLKNYGFKQSYADYSLFSLCKGSILLHVLFNVDDLIITRNNSMMIQKFKGYLSSCFHLKDLGPLKYFLEVEVACGSSGLLLSQCKYALAIIDEVGLTGARLAWVPIEQHHRLGLVEGSFMPEPENYYRLVGRLIYLCFTRPDLTYSVHVLSQFMHKPRTAHSEAAFRVVRYLKGNPDLGIHLSHSSELRLTA